MVLLILIALSGILTPVIVGAKSAAKRSQDLSNLRQAAVASSLYDGEYNSSVISTVPLSNAGLLPRNATVSSFDYTEEGYANFFRARCEGLPPALCERPTTYKDSYVPVGDTGITAAGLASLEADPTFGWLIALSDAVPLDPLGGVYTGSVGEPVWHGVYLRLLPDGAVLYRHHILESYGEGVHNNSLSWFADAYTRDIKGDAR